MTVLARFLVYNLLASLAAGLLAWLVVMAAVRLLGLRSSALSFCFFGLPVLKSVLILLGVGLFLPWPGWVFEKWHALALPFQSIWPWLLIWTLGVYLVYRLVVWQARQAVLKAARPAPAASPRVAAVFERVGQAYRQTPCPQCSDDLCCVRAPGAPEPRLLISERLNSPLALTEGGAPAILFPAGLAPLLNDAELAGALAHEQAHFILRRPNWCSASTLQTLTLIDPVAGLAGEYLHRQVEKACDELAVSVTGQPELYAGMLTKSYRFARQQAGRAAIGRLNVLPRLLGFKPLLSERVEHLLAPASSAAGWRQSRVTIWLVWAALVAVLFFSGLH